MQYVGAVDARGTKPEDSPYPENPVAAAIHPNPYPYYAKLLAGSPIYWDRALRLWVASSAEAVNAVLTSDICNVRPLAEPVPKSLVDSPAGDIFGRLVRMKDGRRHCSLKRGVSSGLNSVDTMRVMQLGRRWSERLWRTPTPDAARDALNDFIFKLPAFVMADLLGLPEPILPDSAAWVADLVQCFSPLSTPDQAETGKVAAARLLEAVERAVQSRQPGLNPSLLNALRGETRYFGRDPHGTIIANGIGFLTQSYEATAGLIGNTLVALSSNASVRAEIAATPELIEDVIAEVIRWDPPVQNTRRFVSSEGCIAGREMQMHDAILVVLAAANRDPALNLDPHLFEISRGSRKSFTFGRATHACPGESYAKAIATAAVSRLLAVGIDPAQIPEPVSYRPSLNTRIPVFRTMGPRIDTRDPLRRDGSLAAS